jgi:NAD+ kinase
MKAITEGKYTIESRMILNTTIHGRTELSSPYSLNDVVINNGPVSRIIDIKLEVNGETIVTYRADGLIIATPTGSTAYSMAAGGPIIQPGMAAIVVTPISSFSLNSRPLVFSSMDRLELSAGEGAEKPMLTLDGQVMVELKPEDKVVIRRADFDLKLIVFPENSFFKVLRRKLHWGVAPINEEP